MSQQSGGGGIAGRLRGRLKEGLRYKPGEDVVIARGSEAKSVIDADIHTLRGTPFEGQQGRGIGQS